MRKLNLDNIFYIALVATYYLTWAPVKWLKIIIFFPIAICSYLSVRDKCMKRANPLHLTLFLAPLAYHLYLCLEYALNGGQYPLAIRGDVISCLALIAIYLSLLRFNKSNMPTELTKAEICLGTTLAALGAVKACVYFLNIDFVANGHMGSVGGLSVATDYNLYALCLLLTIISCYTYFSPHVPLLFFLLTSHSLVLYFSGSRRMYLCLLLTHSLYALSSLKGRKGLALVACTQILTLSALPFVMNSFGKSKFYRESPYHDSFRRAFVSPSQRHELLFVNMPMSDTMGLDSMRQENHPSIYRIERIQFAWSIVKTEFRWFEHLFGKGLFLDNFGRNFGYDTDYPHNFILTAYLSTGILGTLVLLYLIANAGHGFLSIRNTSMRNSHALKFLVILLFILTSGLSIWSNLMASTYLLIGLILAGFLDKQQPASFTKRTRTQSAELENQERVR